MSIITALFIRRTMLCSVFLDEKCLLLRNAVIHNDMSCAISKDSNLLAALAYDRNNHTGISLTLISVNSSSMGQILFKRAFGKLYINN